MEIEDQEQFYAEIQVCKVILKYSNLVVSITALAIIIAWFSLSIADILREVIDH